MNKPLALLSLALFAAPFALAQTPTPDNGPAAPPPPGMNAPDHGPMRFHDRPMMRERDRGPMMMHDRGDREMRFGRGPEGLSRLRVPPGTWWRTTELATRIGLSADQVKKID